MSSPLETPDDDWWSVPINRRESIWLALSGVWCLSIFGWMAGWVSFGDQNPVGETNSVSASEFRNAMSAYKAASTETEDGLIVPAGEDVYVGAMRFNWDGLPVALEAGEEYKIHLSSYDVQHGFSVRPEDTLSKHINLQVLPDYEWIVPMTFDEPGTYHVICNEFCGEGHRTMHGTIEVR